LDGAVVEIAAPSQRARLRPQKPWSHDACGSDQCSAGWCA